MLSGAGPVIAGRTPIKATWHSAAGEQFCGVPVCFETVIWSVPGVAKTLSGMRAHITELEIPTAASGVTCEPCWTETLFVEMKFVPVTYTS